MKMKIPIPGGWSLKVNASPSKKKFMKKHYNKLVRDKIPDIIKKQNKKYEIKYLDDIDYFYHLILKLREEVKEFEDDPCIEELADIKEVITALSKLFTKDEDDLMITAVMKKHKNGSFNKRILLKWVEEKNADI